MKLLRKLINRIRGIAPYDTSKFLEFGKKSSIRNPLSIKNAKRIQIGDNVSILANAKLECWTSYENIKLNPMIIIGDRVSIGYNFSISATDKVVIEEDVLIASNVYL